MAEPVPKPSVATQRQEGDPVSSTPAAVPATERLADETTEVQRSSSDPSLGSSRRKRRKTHPHPASDVYVSEFSPTDKAGGLLARDLKDPQVVSAKQAFYEKLATVLILSDGSGLGDCVVLQKTKNEKLIEMSPFTALVDHFPKQMRMPEGSFRVIVNAQFSDNQGSVACNPPRQAFRQGSFSHLPISIVSQSSPVAAMKLRSAGDHGSTARR